ncbi:MAG TPA: tetratricopeptide repeat protein [Chitinophagales bacterium]|nr:tetratricopeptide repeat protein [Chitinophagales bacterium]
MAKQKTQNTKQVSHNKGNSFFTTDSNRLYAIIVFAFSFIVYFNTVFNDYNLDDELVTQNHRLTSKGFAAIPEIFSSPYYQDESGYKYEYRPLVLVSFAIENALLGEHAWLSHLINVILYALLCVLLLKVLQILFNSYSVLLPFFTTLLFAAHPVHTEVVASIKNRDEIMAVGFGLLSLYYAICYAKTNQKILLVPVLLLFVAAILSKTSALTFVIISPLLLVVFTDIKPINLLPLVLALVIPATLLSRLQLVLQQVILFVLLTATPYFFYTIKHLPRIWQFARNYLTAVITTATQPAIIDNNSVIDTNYYKDKRQIILPILIVVVSTALSIVGYRYGNVWLTLLPLSVLSLLFTFTRNELRLLLILPLSVLTMISLPVFTGKILATEALLIVLLASVALSGNGAFKLQALLAYFIYAVICVYFKHSAFFVIAIGFLLFTNKRFRPAILVFSVLCLALYGYSVYNTITLGKAITLKLLALPVILLGTFAMWRGKYLATAQTASLLIPVVTLAYFFIQPPAKGNLAFDMKNSYNKVSSFAAADPTPVQAVRPLVYMEAPVTAKDPLSTRVGTSLVILAKYTKLICLPYPLSFYYGYAVVTPTNVLQPSAILSLALHFILLVIALAMLRSYPLPASGLLVYLVSIVVFANFVTPIPGLMGDRFLFIPSIGFSIALSGLLLQFFKLLKVTPADIKLLSKPFTYTLLTILVLYSGLTIARNRDWKDRITLFRKDIPAVEQSAQAHNLLALHLFISSNKEPDRNKQNELRKEAATHFVRALEIYPRFLNASFDYARLLEAMGKYDEALKAYQHTTTIDSNFTSPYFSMGIIYQNLEQYGRAAECYEKYLSNHQKEEVAYANLSFAYYKQGLYEKSIEVSRRSIAANPNNSFNPMVNIAKTYYKMQVNDSALFYFEQAQRLNPNDANTARFIQQLRNIKQ